MTDLLLINPSFADPGKSKYLKFDPTSMFGVTPPLGLIYVAANVLNAGFSVEFLDMEAESIHYCDLGGVDSQIIWI